MSEHCGLCWGNYVITWASVLQVTLPISSLYFPNWEKETQDIRHHWEIGNMDIRKPMALH